MKYSYDRTAKKTEPSEANLGYAAGSAAAKAYAKGERWSPGGATTYPRKHYKGLEDMFGSLTSKQLTFFNKAYNRHMESLTTGKEPRTPLPRL